MRTYLRQQALSPERLSLPYIADMHFHYRHSRFSCFLHRIP